MTKPNVSLIIPVYNTAPWLARCLDSVLGQSLSNLEILCVNDGSTDNSLEILKNYAKKDSRIKLFNLPFNKGSAYARNLAIQAANGETLGFVDSDDYLDEFFYEHLFYLYSHSQADIAKGRRIDISENGICMELYSNHLVKKDKFNFCYHWTTAIFRRKIIVDKKIGLPVNVTDKEDIAFLLKYMYCARNIIFSDDAFYYYVERKSSSSHRPVTLKKMADAINAYIDVINFINIHDGEYENLAFKSLFLCKDTIERSDKNLVDKEKKEISKLMLKLWMSIKDVARKKYAIDSKGLAIVEEATSLQEWTSILTKLVAINNAKKHIKKIIQEREKKYGKL